ncbi:MAG: tetratricopeptide repeat protein [Bacteroidaceae bacterium]
MKCSIFTVALLLATGCAFAQKENVKKAKSALNADKPNYTEAISAIQAAMNDETTKDDPETYNIAGKLYRKMYEDESTKELKKEPYDTTKLYNSVLEMFKYYQLCDQKAQLPDAKGKIRKNKWREDNQKDLQKYHGQLFNAGAVVYLMKKKNYKKAVQFLGEYIDMANIPMLADLNLLTDSAKNQTAFYAAYGAYYAKDYPNTIKYAKMAINAKSEKDQSVAYQMLTSAYKETGDTLNWVNMLQEGVKRNPTAEANIVQLINYYNEKGKPEDAMGFADRLIANDPKNDYSYFIKGVLLQGQKKNKEALEQYKKAIAINPNKPEYYGNSGTVYIEIAQDLDGHIAFNSPTYKQEQKVVNQNYIWARENFEKVRQLAPDKEDIWVAPLYRIYYKLGIRQGEDFQDLQKRMEAREGKGKK